MKAKCSIFLTIFSLFFSGLLQSQDVTMSKERMIALTPEWGGERFPDGRPKVPDDILERIKKVSIEQAWSVLRGEGYHNNFEGNWKKIHQDVPVVGRAVTAKYMPSRPDVDSVITAYGQNQQGRIGSPNSWPIDELRQGDVYVANSFGKIVDGTLIGDNLGNAIYANSGNGVVFDGSLRDLGGLEEIEGFNAFVRGWDPSFIQGLMLTGLNTPMRIGRAIVMPGDIVLAKREGVLFIPAHLAEQVVETAEIVMLKDQFGHEMLNKNEYTPGQIDGRWSEEINDHFARWLDENKLELPVPEDRVEELLENRTW